ncbi:MAG: hypothetical protein H7A23_15260 [Leptospiraceae bacterium]|nr:hypothetical protein [Leptospiraceae bacterium]MCP5495909.1 hypothetical protein [Leptospiraceae bacterium]
MTEDIHQDLVSALSKLSDHFADDPEALHLAVAIVFSSILRKYNLSCILVGGQSAAYWSRTIGSTDTDFVSRDTDIFSEILLKIGFYQKDNFSFRFYHPSFNILIELVGEKIEIGNIKNPRTVYIKQNDINDPLVKSLMKAPAEIIDPTLTFINYVEASIKSSEWFDYEDEGALAIERALALFSLYHDYILDNLNTIYKNNIMSKEQSTILLEKFGIKLK